MDAIVRQWKAIPEDQAKSNDVVIYTYYPKLERYQIDGLFVNREAFWFFLQKAIDARRVWQMTENYSEPIRF